LYKLKVPAINEEEKEKERSKRIKTSCKQATRGDAEGLVTEAEKDWLQMQLYDPSFSPLFSLFSIHVDPMGKPFACRNPKTIFYSLNVETLFHFFTITFRHVRFP
jgi:hypothetical protein